MNLPYLPKGKSWSDITREERYFCSEIYHEFKSKPSELVKILNRRASLKLDESDDWELGF